MKHHSVEYANIRLRNLSNRIQLVERMHPATILDGGRTAADRLRLDRIAYKNWESLRAKFLAEEIKQNVETA